jgi:GH15 family glucan-1,4-alpha-glucosidase
MTGNKLIEDYGIIGNLETCPLVGRDGSIDWCCFPHIESSSVFAAILDNKEGGWFTVQPTEDFESEQEYVERTNVLRTLFSTNSGTVTLTDFMPVINAVLSGSTPNSIYRQVTCTEGTVEIDLEFVPRFNYARTTTTVEHAKNGILARGNGEQLFLSTPSEASFEVGESVEAATDTFTLGTDETAWFVLQYNDREPRDPSDCEALLRETINYWQEWAHQCVDESGCRFSGPWHDYAVRSGLTLRLLMNPVTHAIAAAPTTSLPEVVGASRNWDYRYAWIRDVAFTIRALYELGHEQEARSGFDWCLTMCYKDNPSEINHPLYGLHYETEAVEEELDHLSGYRDSTPVRVGNAAGSQEQLDTYGELIMAIYTATNYGEDLYAGSWEVLQPIIDHVCEVWSEKDSGIWEVRGESQHVVHSKVLCWAAIDRGILMAEEYGFDAPLSRWKEERQQIKETVLERGFNESLGSFTQTFDGEMVDASALRFGAVDFLPFEDERIQGTIDTVIDQLATDEGLVRRYTHDNQQGRDNPFVMCTFWLIDCLALSGRVEEAREIFENVMEYVSPLGLFAEEIDPETGEQRGNFPQAFSHVGLVNSALHLSEATNNQQN